LEYYGLQAASSPIYQDPKKSKHHFGQSWLTFSQVSSLQQLFSIFKPTRKDGKQD
jgi:hypothetical protein